MYTSALLMRRAAIRQAASSSEATYFASVFCNKTSVCLALNPERFDPAEQLLLQI